MRAEVCAWGRLSRAVIHLALWSGSCAGPRYRFRPHIVPAGIKKPTISAAAVAMTTSRQLNLFVKSAFNRHAPHCFLSEAAEWR